MKLLLENLPQSLQPQRETLRRCLEAMDRALPLERVLLFGSHARGEAREDSDVDLCLVSDGAERQLDAARQFRLAITGIWPHPPFSLVPITSQRLLEKQDVGDHFFYTVLEEGIPLAAQD